MNRRKATSIICLVAVVILIMGISPVYAQGSGGEGASSPPGATLAQAQDQDPAINPNAGKQRVTQADRTAAAANAIAAGYEAYPGNPLDIGPGDQPDYFGMPNYATSPLPEVITTAAAPVWYFAEGTCRPNFDPYFTIQNPGNIDADVAVTYMTGDGRSVADSLKVRKNSRATVQPRDKLGTGYDAAHDFSAKVQCINGQSILVERPMYFNYDGKWSGGHNVVGANAPGSVFYFAEGTTRPNFETYFTILNAAGAGANVKLTYYRGDGTTKTQTFKIPKRSRATAHPADVLGVGDGKEYDFSTKVECTNGKKIVAERPMYFNFEGKWNGGHQRARNCDPRFHLLLRGGHEPAELRAVLLHPEPGRLRGQGEADLHEGRRHHQDPEHPGGQERARHRPTVGRAGLDRYRARLQHEGRVHSTTRR